MWSGREGRDAVQGDEGEKLVGLVSGLVKATRGGRTLRSGTRADPRAGRDRRRRGHLPFDWLPRPGNAIGADVGSSRRGIFQCVASRPAHRERLLSSDAVGHVDIIRPRQIGAVDLSGEPPLRDEHATRCRPGIASGHQRLTRTLR